MLIVIVVFQTIRHSFIRHAIGVVYVSNIQINNLYTVLLGKEFIYLYRDKHV